MIHDSVRIDCHNRSPPHHNRIFNLGNSYPNPQPPLSQNIRINHMPSPLSLTPTPAQPPFPILSSLSATRHPNGTKKPPTYYIPTYMACKYLPNLPAPQATIPNLHTHNPGGNGTQPTRSPLPLPRTRTVLETVERRGAGRVNQQKKSHNTTCR